MVAIWNEYWPLLLAALLIGIVVGLWLFRPRQRVRLRHDATPLRPHMAASPDGDSGRASGAASVALGVAGAVIGSAVEAAIARPQQNDADQGRRGDDDDKPTAPPPDDLQRLKGVGPKLARLLNEQGISRYEQLAAMSGGDLARLDEKSPGLSSRLSRDQVVLQAELLARGDVEQFEKKFGKLG